MAQIEKGDKMRGKKPVPTSTVQEEPPAKPVVTAAISPAKRKVDIPPTLSVAQLAELLGYSPVEVIKQLMRNGVMSSINQVIDHDTAAVVASDFGFAVAEKAPITKPTAAVDKETRKRLQKGGVSSQLRPPIVTIMGHVDHGKTSLLDAIRSTNVVAAEAGAITQHIGAYQIEVNGSRITFLDTPGHEAFTAMRARGTQVTDIVVLVVAVDDGVMPQTIEAINHARAAEVPIVVALNKMDKLNANPDVVKKQLADLGLLIEEWGGDVICVPVSAKKKQGIPKLLENILLVAEMEQLTAEATCPAEGTVVEAGMDKTRGPIATLLVQRGTLKPGDTIVTGDTWGKVKAMFDDRGKRVKKAEPATPVAVLGMNSVPQAGNTFSVVADEKQARAMLEQRQAERRAQAMAIKKPISLEDAYAQLAAGRVKELNIVLKTDVQGSIEPIKNSLEQLEAGQSKVRIIHSASGSISESDVLLALASKGIVIGFNTSPDPGAKRLAETEGVDIRVYSVIYDMVSSVEKALKGMLEPKIVEVVEGRAEVRAIFPARKGKVAGVFVTEGKVNRGALARIVRQGKVLHDSTVSSLRRFKENVNEVAAGFEAGVGIEGFTDFEVGDIIELYRKEKQLT